YARHRHPLRVQGPDVHRLRLLVPVGGRGGGPGQTARRVRHKGRRRRIRLDADSRRLGPHPRGRAYCASVQRKLIVTLFFASRVPSTAIRLHPSPGPANSTPSTPGENTWSSPGSPGRASPPTPPLPELKSTVTTWFFLSVPLQNTSPALTTGAGRTGAT